MMLPASSVQSIRDTESNPKCPACGSDVFYKYGKTHTGRTRHLCLVCNKQFSLGARFTLEQDKRPLCPVCGKRMHIYHREKTAMRFRCMDYPSCRTFVKVEKRGDNG
jgi:transposase-like protein